MSVAIVIELLDVDPVVVSFEDEEAAEAWLVDQDPRSARLAEADIAYLSNPVKTVTPEAAAELLAKLEEP